jgi:choline-sulfatase
MEREDAGRFLGEHIEAILSYCSSQHPARRGVQSERDSKGGFLNSTRRDLLRATGLACLPGLRAQTKRPPNVLLLMSDQHRRDAMGAAGSRNARTPHLDLLAATGTRFDSAYCTNPVCTPSRASLLTGLYTHHHQAWTNTVPWPREHRTMAHFFGAAGYQTALIGKMHFVDGQTHGFDYHLDFNDWYQFLGPKTRLYAEELQYANSGSGLPQIDDLWRDEGDPWTKEIIKDGREGSVAVGRVSRIPEFDQFESFVSRESVRFLKQHGREAPFFLISSFLKPHDPFMPVQRFADMFSPEKMILPDTWGKVDLKTAPKEVAGAIMNNRPTPELKDREQALRRIAYYHASLAQMDDALGRVTGALEELGLADHTIVLYTSDHGEMLGDHGLWQKFQFYEGSGGVPLLMRVPGVTGAGSVCRMPVSQVQIAATLAELCGFDTPPGLDGASFARQVRQPSDVRPNMIYAEYASRTPGAKYMIREGNLKYTLRTHDADELFDLAADPAEMNNLALQAAGREQASRLKERLFAWYRPPEL